MLGLFTLPDHRGKGVAKLLCQEALGYLRSYRQQHAAVSVRLMVKRENRVAVKLYQELGFVHAGNCTLAEALTANGDVEFLPEDISDEKYSTKTGLVLIARISRDCGCSLNR